MNKGRVLVLGAYGDANIGDDLLLEMVIDLLLTNGFHSNKIIVAGRRSSYMSKLFDGIKVIKLARVRFVRSDYVILGGGTQFFSFSSQPKIENRIKVYLKILFQDPIILYEILKSGFRPKLKVIKIAMSIGLGPFYNQISENRIKSKLSSFDQIFCRDSQSLFYCEKWGISAQLTADLCLSDLFRQKYSNDHKFSAGSKKVIGIVLRDWIQNDNGEIINTKMLDYISENDDHIVKIFIFSKFKDSKLIGRIYESGLVGEENIHVWDPDTGDFKTYLKTISFCDIIITTRYHAAIFALNYSIPAICLAIDPKLKYLVQEVDGFTYCEIGDIQYLSKFINEIFLRYSQIQLDVYNSYVELNKRSNTIFTIF